MTGTNLKTQAHSGHSTLPWCPGPLREDLRGHATLGAMSSSAWNSRQEVPVASRGGKQAPQDLVGKARTALAHEHGLSNADFTVPSLSTPPYLSGETGIING